MMTMMTTVALRRGAATAALALGVAALALLVSLALLAAAAAAGALVVRALYELITGGPTTRGCTTRLLPSPSALGRVVSTRA
jgi:hypothetical protein